MAPSRRVSSVHSLMNSEDASPPLRSSDSRRLISTHNSVGSQIIDILKCFKGGERPPESQGRQFRPTLPPINTPDKCADILGCSDTHPKDTHSRETHSEPQSTLNTTTLSHNSVNSSHQQYRNSYYPSPLSANHQGSEWQAAARRSTTCPSTSSDPRSSNSSQWSKTSLSSLLNLHLAGPNALNSPRNGSSRFEASSASQGSSFSQTSSNQFPEPVRASRPLSNFAIRSSPEDLAAVQTLAFMRTGYCGSKVGDSRWSQIAQGEQLPLNEDEVSPTNCRSLHRLETSRVQNSSELPILPALGSSSSFPQAQHLSPSQQVRFPISGDRSSLAQALPFPHISSNPAYADSHQQSRQSLVPNAMHPNEEQQLSHEEVQGTTSFNQVANGSSSMHSHYGYGPVQNEELNAMPLPATTSDNHEDVAMDDAPPSGQPQATEQPATEPSSIPGPVVPAVGRTDRTFVCMFAGNGIPCDTANNNARKGFSDFFGRNKVCTKAIPHHCWDWVCRQHYQRSKYRCSKNKLYAAHKAERIIQQLEKMEYFMGAATFPEHGPVQWTIGYQKELATALRKADDRVFRGEPHLLESSDPKIQTLMKQVDVATRIRSLTGEEKTAADCIAFIRELKAAGDAVGLVDLAPAEMLPIKWGGVERSRGVAHRRR